MKNLAMPEATTMNRTPNFSRMIPTVKSFEQPNINRPVKASLEMNPGARSFVRPKQLNMIPQRDPGMQMLNCKPIGKAMTRRPGVNDTQGIYPKSGAQRGDRLGLASSHLHPTNLPLLKQAGSHYAGLSNRLGLPR